MTRADNIKDTLDDLILSFLYYDRKEDDSLPRGAIEEAINNGEVSIAQLCSQFEAALRRSVGQ